MRINLETKKNLWDILDKVDHRLLMFASTCCDKCTSTACEGPLNIKDRATCKKYNTWLKLSEAKRTKLFSKALIGEFITLEKIVYEYKH